MGLADKLQENGSQEEVASSVELSLLVLGAALLEEAPQARGMPMAPPGMRAPRLPDAGSEVFAEAKQRLTKDNTTCLL